MNTSPLCPECGKPLPAGSDHCPACLMAQAMASRTLDGDSGKTVPRPPPEPEEIAGKFPQFEILECLGRGGMGVVYKARQKALDRIVAIKILAGEWQDDPGFAGRFEKEAKLLAKLNHPNIVTIHDFGNADGLFHIVMEFIDGVNVRDLLRDGKMVPEQALAIVPPICNALQFAHDHGIVHRDIKPENILLDREGRVKIADFGIATLAGDAADRSGTPAYMAPEQEAHAARIDHRADIYALGVVLYEMLTGERPTTSPVAPSKQVQIDVRLDEVVLRALENKPELRFQQASEIRSRVETIMDRRPAALLKTQEGCLSLQPVGGQRMPSPTKGALSLHTDRLVISTRDGPREVPLEAIRAIGVAVMPAWFSLGGHRYLSVDFEEAGKPGRLVFLPIEGNFGLPATTVRRVQDWLHAIGQAVQSAKGRSLPEPSPLPAIIPVNSAVALWWLLPAAMVLFGVVMFGMMVARSVPETSAEPFWILAIRATAKMAMWIFLILSPGLILVLMLRRKPASPREGNDMRSYLAAGIFLIGLLGTPLLLSITEHQIAALGFGGACLLASLVLGIASWRTPLGRFMTFVGSSLGIALLAMAAIFSARSDSARDEETKRRDEQRAMAELADAREEQSRPADKTTRETAPQPGPRTAVEPVFPEAPAAPDGAAVEAGDLMPFTLRWVTNLESETDALDLPDPRDPVKRLKVSRGVTLDASAIEHAGWSQYRGGGKVLTLFLNAQGPILRMQAETKAKLGGELAAVWRGRVISVQTVGQELSNGIPVPIDVALSDDDARELERELNRKPPSELSE